MMMMRMIIERINCVNAGGHELSLYLTMEPLGRKSPLKASPYAQAGRAFGQTSDAPYMECGIFPDTDQLCLSERVFGPLSGTKVGGLTALRGERRGLLSHWRIRQSELISAVSCQRLALKGDF